MRQIPAVTVKNEVDTKSSRLERARKKLIKLNELVSKGNVSRELIEELYDAYDEYVYARAEVN